MAWTDSLGGENRRKKKKESNNRFRTGSYKRGDVSDPDGLPEKEPLKDKWKPMSGKDDFSNRIRKVLQYYERREKRKRSHRVNSSTAFVGRRVQAGRVKKKRLEREIVLQGVD